MTIKPYLITPVESVDFSMGSGVSSVNTMKGDVVLTADSLNAQPKNQMLTKISTVSWAVNTIMAMDSSSSPVGINYTDYSKKLLSFKSKDELIADLGMNQGSYPVTSVNSKTGSVTLTASDLNAASLQHTHPISDITNLQNILDSKMSSTAKISYDNITNKPNIFSGDYNDLSNKPILFSGNYADLKEKPEFSKVAISGSYKDLDNLPNIFDGDYNSLSNKPTIPSVNYPVTSVNSKTKDVILNASDVGAANAKHTHDIAEITGLQDTLDSKISTGSAIPYSSLTGVPAPTPQVNSDWSATTGAAQILNKPLLFSGSYLDLTNKPQLFSGNYSDLNGKPTIPSAQIQADWNQTTTTALDFIKNKPNIPVVSYPVLSVNNKTGSVVLSSTDVGAAPVQHTHSVDDVTGLSTILANKVGTGDTIPYSKISGTPTIPATQIQSNWTQTDNTALDFIKNKPTIPTVSYPVLSVNGKTGSVVLNSSDTGSATATHTHVIGDVSGLQSTLDSKVSIGSSIPYSTLTGAPTIPVNNSFTLKGLSDTDDLAVSNGFLRWNSTGSSVSYSTTIPYSVLTGAPTLSTVATTGSYNDITNKPVLFSGAYADLTGKPVIPTVVSSLTNDSGYVTSTTAPVTSVNTKTGAITLTAADVGAATSAQGTKYYRSTGVQATGVKVKYYTTTSDANGAWSLSLGTDFTEILDVQVQAVSSTGVNGVRQATINTYTSTATSLTGSTYGNTAITTLLATVTNTFTLTPNTSVRLRIEGLGT